MAVMITLVRAPACHFCEDARAVLAELRRDFDLDVHETDADSDVGSELVARHRPAMFPLVLVDGLFFSVGRLSRGKLRRLLDARDRVGARP
jgi:glutaredoxin